MPGLPVILAHPSAMHAAPPSCRAATYRAPWLIRALVTWKLPLPTTPNTVSTPSPARVAATASVTRIGSGALGWLPGRTPYGVLGWLPGRTPYGALGWLPGRAPYGVLDEGDGPARAARPAGDRQRPGDHHRADRRQEGQVLQLREPVLARAQQRGVARERRVEGVRRPGVGADRLHAEPDDRLVGGQPLRAGHRDARGVRSRRVGIEELFLAGRPRVPAGPVQQPAAPGQRAVLGLPVLDVLDLEQEVGI